MAKAGFPFVCFSIGTGTGTGTGKREQEPGKIDFQLISSGKVHRTKTIKHCLKFLSRKTLSSVITRRIQTETVIIIIDIK